MILSFLIDSRYGGPQMINNHINKNIFKKYKTIFLDKENKYFKFVNFKKKLKIFYLIDIIINLLVLFKKKNFFFKYKIFFVFSIINIIPIIFGILLKKKIVWYILEQPNTLFFVIFKILNFYSDLKIICISDSLGKQLKIEKYNVYFPSINNYFWKKSKKNKVKKNIIQITCVGNINITKNHLQLVDFLIKSKKTFYLNIVGKRLNSQREYFEKLNIKIKNINKNTSNKITIYQNKKEKFIKNILNKTDLYILPSLSEGLSVSLIEAMSMEKLCMVSKPSNHSNIVKNNKNGLVFNLNIKSFLRVYNYSLSMNILHKNKIKRKARNTVKELLIKNRRIEKKLKVSFFETLN